MSLYLVAFLGGVLTVLSPCILPVLPFVFAGPSARGRRLPLLAGMALAFAAAASLGAVAGQWAVEAQQWGRVVALVALATFAAALLSPRVATWLARPFVRLGERLLPAADERSWLGAAGLGVATGLVWTPCAGPILGLLLSGAALAGLDAPTPLLLLAYAGGAAVSLAVVLHLGDGPLAALRDRLAGSPWARRARGAVLLGGVLAIAAGLDTGLLTRLSPEFGTRVEAQVLHAVQRAKDTRTTAAALPVEPIRASLAGATDWLNGAPLTVEALRGKVVLVNFWTYSCINCLRTLPYVKAWAKKYADQGLVVVGVHTPEFAFEKDPGNVRRALKDLQIDYPVVQDNDFAIWRAFDNRYWPALYVVDARGRVRHHQFGEGGQARMEEVLQALLRDAGGDPAKASAAPADLRGTGMPAAGADVRSGETYVGYAQARGFASEGGVATDRAKDYTVGALRTGTWGLAGRWNVGAEYARLDAAGGAIALRFHARDAHLVLGPSPGGGPVRFRVTLDGQPPGADHGDDVDAEGNGTLDTHRLVQLVRQRGPVDDRTVEVRFLDQGVRAYAFTFG